MQLSTWNSDSYREEGKAAAKSGVNSWDNPYDYRFEALAANAWDEGYKCAQE